MGLLGCPAGFVIDSRSLISKLVAVSPIYGDVSNLHTYT